MTGVAALFLLALGRTAPDTLPVSDPGWTLQAGVTRTEYLGRPAFRAGTGRAFHRAARLEDGTIDVDVALNGKRSFVYLQYRMATDDEHEEIYLRPHKSGLPDAVQYAPVFRGESAWQLYHREGHTAEVEFETGRWVRVRLVLSGRQAALFVGDTTRPVMVVPRMARDPVAGYLALRGFVPQGSRATEAAYFSNVVVRPGFIPFRFAPVPAPAALAGVVGSWELSESFVADTGTIMALPSLEGRRWTTATADPDGLVVVNRFLPRPGQARRSTTIARIRVEAATAETRALALGFSDEMTVFLNGRPVAAARAPYSYNFPRQEGLIGLEQQTVFLPLVAGANEVAVALTDGFGGWGIMGRWVPSAGRR